MSNNLFTNSDGEIESRGLESSELPVTSPLEEWSVSEVGRFISDWLSSTAITMHHRCCCLGQLLVDPVPKTD